MRSVTVRDVLRLALPIETTVVAGAAGVNHPITWVATLRATLPAFAELRGGELALLSVSAALALDPRLTLANLVRRLATAPVAAVAVVGPVEAEDISAAEEARLPLLRLPDGSDLREVEREVGAADQRLRGTTGTAGCPTLQLADAALAGRRWCAGLIGVAGGTHGAECGLLRAKWRDARSAWAWLGADCPAGIAPDQGW